MTPLPELKYRSPGGFTLIEMAIVLAIVMALTGGLIAGLSAQMDAHAQAQTEQTLADIREALLGFAASQGRLPCPAAPPTAGGTESPANGSTNATPCNNSWNGYVPGTTLGLTPTDQNGYVLDGWNQPIRYAVTRDHSNAFTTPPGAPGSNTGIRGWGIATLTPDLTVCSVLNGTTACSDAAHTLTANAVATLYSLGKNGANTGTDQQANQDNNQVFVSHAPTATSGNVFDDQVTWISPYTLYSRMIAAGVLP
ncbi:MAG: type II secretion system protein [Rhodocyclaceae bacterium]|nr:type II secretion system protein [Rhodocyclaceae bacterium]